MRGRWALVASLLTCTVLLTAYKSEATRAQALPGELPDGGSSVTAAGANGNDTAGTLAPGDFRFTIGLDHERQHIQGPVTCDTRGDVRRISIGDPNAGGVEIGLSEDESTLKYVDLGYRNGVFLMLVNDGDAEREVDTAPAVRKSGETYFTSGYATAFAAGQHETERYFELSVACP